MHCIIIEDQPPAQRILKKYIQDIGSLDLLGTFSNAIEAMEFLKSTAVDLIFLDVHLPKISGIEFLKIMSNPPLVVLTTAFPNYALESYEFDVVDYLLKPFAFKRFEKAVARAFERKSTVGEPKKAQEALFIKSGYEHIKVTISEIVYIKSDADYSEIILTDKKYLSTKPLRHWEEQLAVYDFMRVHKSYVVNLSKVQKIATNRISLGGDIIVPIGRAYKETVLEHLERHQ